MIIYYCTVICPKLWRNPKQFEISLGNAFGLAKLWRCGV